MPTDARLGQSPSWDTRVILGSWSCSIFWSEWQLMGCAHLGKFTEPYSYDLGTLLCTWYIFIKKKFT